MSENLCSPVRQPEVTEELSHLAGSITELEEVVSILITSIDPILRGATPRCDDDKDEQSLVNVARDIRSNRKRVAALISTIADAHSRVEV